MTAARLQSVLIAGGGVAGLWAAAALANSAAGLRLLLVDDPALLPQPLDCQPTLLPATLDALRRLGLAESALLAAGGRIRLAYRVHDETGPEKHSLVPEGQVGVRIGLVPFARAWLEAARTGAPAPFAVHAVAAALVERGRFAPPVADPGSPLSTFDYGINVAPLALRSALAAVARRRGVQIEQASLAGVERDGPDRVASVVTKDGRRLTADLFIDASGAAAHLLSALAGDDGRESWAAWLPADRIWATTGPSDPTNPPADDLVLRPSGCRLRVLLANEVRHLVAGGAADDKRARLAHEVQAEPPRFAADLSQGVRRRPRIGNCIAVGDAAVSLEPIGGWPLALLARQIEHLVALLPERQACPALEQKHCALVCRDSEEVRNLAAIGHHLARRAGHDKKAARNSLLPDSAAAFLAHFEARGTLKRRDHAFVTDDEWYALLIALGARTIAPDPLAAEVSPARFDQASAAIRAALAAAVDALPVYPPRARQ